MPIYDLYSGSVTTINFHDGDTITNTGTRTVFFDSTQAISLGSPQLAPGDTRTLIGSYWLMVPPPGPRGRVEVIERQLVSAPTGVDLSGYVTDSELQQALLGITPTSSVDKQRIEFGSVAGSLAIPFDSRYRVIVASFTPVAAVSVTTRNLAYGQELWLDISQPATGGFAVSVPQSIGSFTIPTTGGSQTVATFASLDGVSLVPTQIATPQTTLQSALSITSSAIQTGT